MSRNLTSTMQSGLASRVVRPVLIGRLDIAGDAVTAWTGPGLFAPSGTGDSALDGQTFSPAAAFVSLSAVTEDQSTGGPVTVTATAHSDAEPLLRQIVTDKRAWRGRPAYLWLGLLDDTEAVVLANPVRIKTGVMTSMLVRRDAESATIDVVIDVDLGNSRSAPFRWIDHPRFYPTDTFSTFAIRLANRPGGFESASPGALGPGSPDFDPTTIPFFERP